MPKHVIKSDRTTQWIVDQDGDTWIIEKQAKLDVSPGPSLLIGNGFDNNKLEIAGDIFASGPSATAILNNGDRTVMNFGAKATISGEQGIAGGGDGTRIVNHGAIETDDVGIAQNGNFTLVNSGEITSDIAVSVAQAKLIDNRNGGEINGGIWLFGDGESRIVNRGLITQGMTGDAIIDQEGKVTIRNMGRIEGPIALGGGDDVLDTLKGRVTGEIHGGNGNDTYKIAQAGITIVEGVNEGYDTVYSSVSFTLPANVNGLILVGRKDIDATGGGYLRGNRGDNDLDAGLGFDTLLGAAGRDRLTGGGGSDFFQFRPHADLEIVLDFEDGVDRIVLYAPAIAGESDAVERLEQHGNDVWLQANGTKMVIKNIDIDLLDTGDFLSGLVP